MRRNPLRSGCVVFAAMRARPCTYVVSCETHHTGAYFVTDKCFGSTDKAQCFADLPEELGRVSKDTH
jgi:hypothetical protein